MLSSVGDRRSTKAYKCLWQSVRVLLLLVFVYWSHEHRTREAHVYGSCGRWLDHTRLRTAWLVCSKTWSALAGEYLDLERIRCSKRVRCRRPSLSDYSHSNFVAVVIMLRECGCCSSATTAMSDVPEAPNSCPRCEGNDTKRVNKVLKCSSSVGDFDWLLIESEARKASSFPG